MEASTLAQRWRGRRHSRLPRRDHAGGLHSRPVSLNLPHSPMTTPATTPLDLSNLRVYPLEQRVSQSRLDEIMVEPADAPKPCDEFVERIVRDCARKVHAADARGAAVMLIYGAHLIKNGGQLLLNQ